jgi:hypothetical protein
VKAYQSSETVQCRECGCAMDRTTDGHVCMTQGCPQYRVRHKDERQEEPPVEILKKP